jgi:hypothetical protein
MRTSSARQLELSDLNTIDHIQSDQGAVGSVEKARPLSGASVTEFTPLSAPSASAYAVASRLLGRLNTTMVEPQELKDLLRERQQLLDKKFDRSITRQEENRLEYIRWSLERIEDARSGQSLDVLEGLVGGYRQFISDMNTFGSQLQRAASKRRTYP